MFKSLNWYLIGYGREMKTESKMAPRPDEAENGLVINQRGKVGELK